LLARCRPRPAPGGGRRHRRTVRRASRTEIPGRAIAGHAGPHGARGGAAAFVRPRAEAVRAVQPQPAPGRCMMRAALAFALLLATLGLGRAAAADPAPQPAPREEVVSDISTREISIQSNFTGIEILIFGSVDFSGAAEPDKDIYDVVVVLRSPDQAVVARRKERMAWIWVNGPGKIYPTVPGFYAVLSSRPLRAITSDETLKTLGIGLNNIDFGRVTKSGPDEETFRSTVIRLKEQQ